MDEQPKKPMKNPFGTDAYRRTEIMTANKETLLLMLYAGAIRFLKRAILACEQNNVADRVNYIQRTQDIIAELRATLNHEVGGELSEGLEALYAFITERLIQGNLQKSPEILKEALGILTTLNSAWEEAIASLRKEKPQTSSTGAK